MQNHKPGAREVAWFRQPDRPSLTADPANGFVVGVPVPAASVEDPTLGDWYVALKRQLHQQVIGAIDLASIGTLGEDQLRMEVRRKAEGLCQKSANLLNLAEREKLINEVLDEAFGSGPLRRWFGTAPVPTFLSIVPKPVLFRRRAGLDRPTLACKDGGIFC